MNQGMTAPGQHRSPRPRCKNNDAFSAKLVTSLQLDAGSINVHAPRLDLGFHSLLAVETRSWFLKEASVDVPVLRFLGGETFHEICADAAAQCLSLRSTNGSYTGEGADTNASLTRKADNSDDPVASSLGSSPSIATPPPTSSSTTSTRASLDLPSAQEDLKQEAPGPLDVARLREALVNVVAHHPSLRTCFYNIEDKTGELTQGLLRQRPTSALLLKQVRAVTRADGVIDRELSALKKQEWDLEYGETFCATLVHVEDEDSYVVIFGYPLIVIDGVSWSIFLRDLGRAYSMQPLSRQAKLCIDAAAGQRRAVESMSGAMQERIKDVSRALRATPFHFYLATAQALFESAAGLSSVTVTCMSYLYIRNATEALIAAYVYLLDALASDVSRTLS